MKQGLFQLKHWGAYIFIIIIIIMIIIILFIYLFIYFIIIIKNLFTQLIYLFIGLTQARLK
jgi:hypothetical protein